MAIELLSGGLFNKIVDTVLSKVNWICDYCALIKQTLIY